MVQVLFSSFRIAFKGKVKGIRRGGGGGGGRESLTCPTTRGSMSSPKAALTIIILVTGAEKAKNTV